MEKGKEQDFRSSRFIDLEEFSENENQNENIRFSTFEEEYIDEKNCKPINLENVEVQIQDCINILNFIKGSFDELIFTDEIIFNKFVEYEQNYSIHFFNMLFLSRELSMIYILLQYKYNNNKNQSYEEFKTMFNVRFGEINDIDKYYENFINKNKNLFSKLNEDDLIKLKEHIKISFGYEKELLLIEKENYKPGLSSCSIAVNYIIMIVNYVIEDLNILKEKSSEENIIIFFSDLQKLNLICSFLYLIYKFDENNIFCKDENSPEWIEMKKNFSRKCFYTRKQLKDSLKKVFDMVTMSYASFSKSMDKNEGKGMNIVTISTYYTYFFFNKKKAKVQSKKFLMSPDTKITLTIWNLLDSPSIKNMVKIALPSIKFVDKFFIKRIEPEITIDIIKQLTTLIKTFNPKDKNITNQIDKIFNSNQDSNNENKEKEKEKKSIEENFSELILLEDIIKSQEKDYSNLIIPKNNPNSNNKTDSNYIKIKVLSSRNFTYQNEEKGLIKTLIKKYKLTKTRNCIMIHIHGGGFVAMSPSSHENYLRKWSNELRIPIFSIDYRLSPEFPFPKALDDCYQVYIWLIKYGEDYFKMKYNEIILSGDSAGGNLCIALTYLLIMKRVKLPKVIFIFYPALKMSPFDLSLSYFNAITDPILGYNLLLFCIKAYLGKFDDVNNPFFSPVFMDDNILKFLPSVRIFGGTKDPLRDDGIYFYEKLVKLGKDVQFTEFKYFPHGYLNYDFPIMMEEVSKANDMIIEEMDKFITEPKKKK